MRRAGCGRQDGGEPVPGVLPRGDCRRVLLTQVRVGDGGQRDQRGVFGDGGVDRFEHRRNGLAVAGGDEPHQGPDQMHYAGLDHRMPPSRLGEAGQPVTADDQDVDPDSDVRGPVRHVRPVADRDHEGVEVDHRVERPRTGGFATR